MPLGFHADCQSTGKWVKNGVCSACGERVVLHRREPEDSDYEIQMLNAAGPCGREARASRQLAMEGESTEFG